MKCRLPLLVIFLNLCIYSNIYAETCPNLTGKVIKKNDANYNQLRLGSNYYTSKNKFPTVIVYASSVKDIQNAIRYANCKKLSVRVRSGGHNHLSYSTGTNVLLIDVSHMKKMTLDKNKQIAVIQPGITGGELYRQLYANGLTQAGGTCGGVGISGLILTGGMGPLARKQGLACDSLLSIDIVDAAGQLIHATKNNAYKDLFWASCGGGGNNFGVVTSLTLKVYPAQTITWFNLGWDWNQPIDKIISLWQTFFLNNDERWYSHLDIWANKFPAREFHQQPIKVIGIFWGTPEDAKRELAPFLKIGYPNTKIIKKASWHQAILELENATKVYLTDKPTYKSSGAFIVNDLPSKAIHLLTSYLHDSKALYLNVLFFSLGGAINKHNMHETAYFYRNAKSFAVYSTQWIKSQDEKKYIDELNTMRIALLPFTKGDYVGNQDTEIQNYLTAYYGNHVRRLRCIKRKYDPNNIFRFEQGIPPALSDWKCK